MTKAEHESSVVQCSQTIHVIYTPVTQQPSQLPHRLWQLLRSYPMLDHNVYILTSSHHIEPQWVNPQRTPQYKNVCDDKQKVEARSHGFYIKQYDQTWTRSIWEGNYICTEHAQILFSLIIVLYTMQYNNNLHSTYNVLGIISDATLFPVQSRCA